ncbi:MAG: hypothetical protein IPJ07_22800 [Acidobacteria bacterium]|nr:hypothetical protein [Acidobacteriota bacterium]
MNNFQDRSELLVRQSDENLARFDPQRIPDALVRETGIAPETAQKIALEVQEQIERSGIRALTAPLIRGMVDSKLLEYGLMKEYRDHSRLGVPVYDVDRIMQSLSTDHSVVNGPEGTSLALAEAIKRDYAMGYVFSEAVAKAHFEGDFHIANLGEVDRPTTMIGSIDFIKRHGVRLPGGFAGSRPARRPEVLASHLVTYTAALQGYFSDAIAWDSVNYAFAPMLIDLNQQSIRQLAQGLFFELSAPTITRGGQPVRCDLHLDWDAPAYLKTLPAVGVGGEKLSTTYGAISEVARNFLKTLLEVFLEGDAQGYSFTGPRLVLHLTHHFLDGSENRRMLDLICRVATERGGVVLVFDRAHENPEISVASSEFSARYGVNGDKLQRDGQSWQWRAANFSSVALNLPRIGFLAGENQGAVFELLTDLLELAAQASLEKRVFLERLLARGESGSLSMLAMRPDGEPFLPLSWTSHAICPLGLAELVKSVIGRSIDESAEAHAFATRVVDHLKSEANRLSSKHKVRFLLGESRDITAPHRMARLDLARFGSRLVGQAFLSGSSPDEAEILYTNSVNLPVDSNVSPEDKIRIEGEIQRDLIWQGTTDLWLGVVYPSTENLAALISNAFYQTRTSAISFSPEYTICTICHRMSRGLHDKCPACGSDRVDGLAQATSRYGRTSTWPQWLTAELKRRRRFDI